MKIKTIEEVAKIIFPNQKGRSVTYLNKTMLRRSAFIKGAKWREQKSENIEKAFNFMINNKNVVFSEKGLLEIKKIYGLKIEEWKIKSIDCDFEIEIESESNFVYSGLGLDMFIF